MRTFSCVTILLTGTMISGCGRRDGEDGNEFPRRSSSAAISAVAVEPIRNGDGVIASVGNLSGGQLPEDGGNVVRQSTPADKVEFLLNSIHQLRRQPLPQDVDETRQLQRQRNLQIVELCTHILQLSLAVEHRRKQFHEGIVQLLEARFQLALNGTPEDTDRLYADVQALNDRDPASDAAAEGIYCLARFAHTKARMLGRTDPAWFENFSRWAREFADRFPQQRMRAVALLFGAGRSCEMHSLVAESESESKRLRTEAKLCYMTLAERFSDMPQGQEAAAVLRRLALPGEKLSQFAGPTLDGGYVDADEFVEQVTVIYFWDSRNIEFRERLLPLLQEADEASNDRLRFVGVNLDDNETQVRSFLSRQSVPGQQIFFTEAALRSWNSPLIRFWGISGIPSVWLVGRDGIVSAVDVGPAQLVDRLRLLFN